MNADECVRVDVGVLTVCIRCLAWTEGMPERCEDCGGEMVWVQPRGERENARGEGHGLGQD